MDAIRKQLDVLMGANRNGDVTEVDRKYYDREVCRLFLSGLCPHELFQLTKMDMGACPKVHSLQLRKEYEEAKAKGEDNYDRDLEDLIDRLIVECDRKITRALKRLDEEDAKAAIAISVSEVTLTPEIDELSKQIKEKLKEADIYDLEGKTDMKIRALEEVEELRTKRADKQSMLLLDAFNKDRASLPQPLQNAPQLAPLPASTPDPRIQEMINEKLKKAEDLGEQGMIEEAQKALEEAEALKKLPVRQEPVQDSSKYTAVDVRITDQKLRVCDICGAFLSVYDSDRRLADHFGGKLHLGYMQIREKLAELQEERNKKRKAIEEDRRSKERRSRERDRESSRDRFDSRDAGRDYGLLKLGALGLLLETARRAFFVDAMEPAEGILLIVESLTLEANESDNISITSDVDVVSSDEVGAGEQAKKIVLLFLERLSHPSGLRKSNKQQRNTEMVARILPYLTYGEPVAMEALVQHFEPCLQNWLEFDRLQKLYEDNMQDETIAQQASKQKYTLENFVRVSESLKTSSCGEILKDIILEKGITGAAVSHLKESFAFTGQVGFRSTVEWASGLKLPSIPLILSMLRGLSMGHLATQKCIDKGGILPLLHALEGVAGENEIGARAENLLDTLSDKEGKGDGFLAQKVHQLRHATKDEMRRRALRRRAELLQGLGMHQELSADGGERIVVSRPVLEGLEDVEDEEEEGLACMVCREGYRLRPTDLLGVYTYSKRVNLGVAAPGNARGDCVYTTVSHFNIIHFQCHQEAKRADAALRTPKKEWDGAAIRNNETLCNNLFPLRGPSVPVGQYIRYVDQYWDYLNALGRADGSRLRLLTYDIVLMLARFATGASFSADCRGGGKDSNARFLPFMVQMARHLLDHDSSQRHIMIKSISTYLCSPASEPRASTTAGTQTSAGTEETVQFMMVTSLLSESYESWLQNRSSFLQRGIYHAYVQRTHGRHVPRSSPNMSGALKTDSGSTSTSGSEAGGSIELFPTIQPMLVYTGLIEQLQRFFKVKKSSVTTMQTQGTSKNVEDDDESRKLEAWEVVMKERLLNVKEMADFSSELLSWLDDMASATDFQEAFDVLGVLSGVLSGFNRCEDYVHAAISGGKN